MMLFILPKISHSPPFLFRKKETLKEKKEPLDIRSPHSQKSNELSRDTSGLKEAKIETRADSLSDNTGTTISVISGQFTWFGRVSSQATGKAIPGAQIVYFVTDEFSKPRFSDDRETRVSTNEKGDYRLTAFPQKYYNLQNVQYLRAQAPGFESQLAMFPDDLIEEGNQCQLDFILPEGGEIYGKVVDEKNQPVKGALVGYTYFDTKKFSFRSSEIQKLHGMIAKTGDHGDFILSGLPKGEKIRIPVLAKGFIPCIEELNVGQRDVCIVLEKSQGRVWGHVLDGENRPVPKAVVSMFPQQHPEMSGWLASSIFMRETITAQDGSFQFTDLKDGPYNVRAQSHLFSHEVNRRRYLEHRDLMLFKGDNLEIELRFPADVTISGRFVDADSQEGVPGICVSSDPVVRIKTNSLRRYSFGEIFTGADGRFLIQVPPFPGMNEVEFYYSLPSGWISIEKQSLGLREERYHCQDIPPGGTKEVQIRIRRGLVLRARVLKPDKTSPCSNTDVTISSKGRQIDSRLTTDEQGCFSWLVPPDIPFSILARTDQGIVNKDLISTKEALAEEIVLILEPMGAISGRVTGKKGEPVSGAIIQPLQLEGVESVNTGEDGFYRLTKIPPRKILFLVEPPQNSGYVPPKPFERELQPGEVLEGIDFQLDNGEILEGTVKNDKDLPIENANVSASFREYGYWSHTKTDAGGRYHLVGIPINTSIQELEVYHPDYLYEKRININPLDGPQDFVLYPQKEVTLAVLDASSGQSVPFYLYRLLENGSVPLPGHNNVRIVNPEGKTSLNNLVPRDFYVIEVEEQDENAHLTGRKGSAIFHWDPQKSQELIVRVGEGRKVAGTVIQDDQERRSVQGALVFFESWDIDRSSHPYVNPSPIESKGSYTDEGGRFEFDNVPPGVYRLNVEKEALNPEKPVTIEVPADRDPDPLTIVLIPGAIVYGRILGPDGKPVPALVMRQRIEKKDEGIYRSSETQTDDQGKYRLVGLLPGRHKIEHAKTEELPYRDTFVDLESGDEKELNFDYSQMATLSGRILINGSPWDGHVFLYFTPLQGGTPVIPKYVGEGRYTVRLDYGGHHLRIAPRRELIINPPYLPSEIFGGIAGEVFISAEPSAQEQDFSVQVSHVEIIVECPEGQDFKKGVVEISQKRGGRVWPLLYILPQEGRTQILTNVPEGEYQALYHSQDGSRKGQSDWTTVTLGDEHPLLILLK